jgi:hypothetical protein
MTIMIDGKTIELSACPWCGSAPVVEEKEYSIRCPNFAGCAARPRVSSNDLEIAVAKWQQRGPVSPTCPQCGSTELLYTGCPTKDKDGRYCTHCQRWLRLDRVTGEVLIEEVPAQSIKGE